MGGRPYCVPCSIDQNTVVIRVRTTGQRLFMQIGLGFLGTGMTIVLVMQEGTAWMRDMLNPSAVLHSLGMYQEPGSGVFYNFFVV